MIPFICFANESLDSMSDSKSDLVREFYAHGVPHFLLAFLANGIFQQPVFFFISFLLHLLLIFIKTQAPQTLDLIRHSLTLCVNHFIDALFCRWSKNKKVHFCFKFINKIIYRQLLWAQRQCLTYKQKRWRVWKIIIFLCLLLFVCLIPPV